MTKIFVAGHNGMVGSAISRLISKDEKVELIQRSRAELDLTNQNDVKDFYERERPDEVILAAARVGGIFANEKYPADFIYDNLQIQNNVIHFAHLNNVQKLLFLGSSCIYPKYAEQPIREQYLLDGWLEPTNEAYAIAKIAGIKLCESYNRQHNRDYRSIMPTNLYGPGDSYHEKNSHVIPALIRRFHDAKTRNLGEVVVWGTGSPRREFLFVDDLALASIFIHRLAKDIYRTQTEDMQSHVNVGTGSDITIFELAGAIKEVVGFPGRIVFDSEKPDGTPKKLLNVEKLNSWGWKPAVPLMEGLKVTYADFCNRLATKQLRI